MRVVFYHRKRYAGNYSIENLFSLIRAGLPSNVDSIVKEMSFISKGFFRRLLLCIEAIFYQADINHITGDINFIALLLNGKRTILTIHDLGYMNHPSFLARIVLRIFWITMPVNKVRYVTTVSTTTKLELLRYSGINPSKVWVIYNPVSPIFIPVKKEFKKNCPIILQIGTKHNKNIPRLIEALSSINCKLHIIGHLQPEYLDLLKRNNISFENFEDLNDEEILEQYVQCDILSFVSTLEGFGLPIVEANAVGRVVITSAISSMPEIAGNSAHLVNPYDVNDIRDGFMKLINDDQYREGLIQRGFRNKRRFEIDPISKQYTRLYHSTLK